MTDPELLAVVTEGRRHARAAQRERHPAVAYRYLVDARRVLAHARAHASPARIRQLTGVRIDQLLADVRRGQARTARQLKDVVRRQARA